MREVLKIRKARRKHDVRVRRAKKLELEGELRRLTVIWDLV